MNMTNNEVIRYCRDLGWIVEEQTEYPNQPTGIYRFAWPSGPRSFAYDYSAYIDTNRERFADAVVRLATDYIREDDRLRASGGYETLDRITREASERVRHAMDNLLMTMRIQERLRNAPGIQFTMRVQEEVE